MAQLYNSVLPFMLQPLFLEPTINNPKNIMQNIIAFLPLHPIGLSYTINPSVFEVKPVETFVEIEQQDGKGRWTYRQQRCYVQFLKENMEVMAQRTLRKSQKIFVKMSRIVKTRTSEQCRSHHQKILHIHKDLQKIIDFYEAGRKRGEKVAFYQNEPKVTIHRTELEDSVNAVVSITPKGNQFKFQIDESNVQNYQ